MEVLSSLKPGQSEEEPLAADEKEESKEEAQGSSKPDHKRGPSKEELREGFARMRKLEWITIFYQIFAAAVVGFLMGGSQAMKTEWMENALAIVPAASVLLTFNTENKSPDHRRPFGYHRAGTIAFVVASFTLASIGTWLFYDSLTKLIHQEYPSIGGMSVFGHTIWQGWLMMAAMLLTGIPPMVLGRMKIPVAKLLHDKALFADADMNRANWMTNGAGAIGLALVAFGFWWGDSLAALIISCDIMHDGWHNVSQSLNDVMDRNPQDLETDQQDLMVRDVHRALRALPFVEDEKSLIREHGRYIFAEIFIKPNDQMPPVAEAGRQVREATMSLDWRLQHIAVEFTDDLSVADVLTREELEIEAT